MKAEQRKELETNTLADKMGHVMQRAKSSQRRTIFLYLIGIAVVAVALWLGLRYWSEYKFSNSKQWLDLYDGAFVNLQELATKDKEKDTNARKAARFQFAWLQYWDFGVKSLASNQVSALKSLEAAGSLYSDLAEDCKGDPQFEPQAILGRAVVEETLAVQHVSHLGKAETHYKNLVENFKESAEAKFAQQRLDLLKKEKHQMSSLEKTYDDLHSLLRIPDRERQFMPGGLDGLPPLKGKGEK